MLELLKKLTQANAPSGNEERLHQIITEEIKNYVDEITIDPLGNLIAHKKGAGPRVMFAAHMDEIGFVVTYIEENGFIRVSNIGGISPVASAYQRVIFENGVVGIMVLESGTAFADIAVKKLIVDIGARSRKEAEKKVKIGDCLAVMPELTRLSSGRYAAKAFDDRLACAVLSEVIRRGRKPAYDTYYVFTVQEEVGCRGSKPAAYAIAPDYAIAVDVTATGDTVGAAPMAVKLGKGAAIKIKDSSVLCSALMVDALTGLAKEAGIPYQYEVLVSGGTDTSSMQTARAGAHAGAVSIPTRYIHSPVETVDIKDVRACADLLEAAAVKGIKG